MNNNRFTLLLSIIPVLIVIDNRINGLVLILLSLYSIYIIISNKLRLDSKIAFASTYFFIILIASIVDVFSSSFESKYIETALSSLFFPVIFYTFQERIILKKLLRNIVYSVSLLNIVLLLYGFYRAITSDEIVYGVWSHAVTEEFYKNSDYIINWPFLTYKRLIEPVQIHPSYYGLLVNIILALLVYMFYRKEISKKLFSIFVVFNILFLFFLSSKANIIALVFVAISLLLIKLSSLGPKVRISAFSSVVVFLILLFSIPSTQFRIKRSYNTLKENLHNNELDSSFGKVDGGTYKKEIDGSTIERIILWRSAIGLFFEKPMLGYGNSGGDEAIRRASGINKNTHNQYLQILVNAGIVGFVMLLFFIGYPMFSSYFDKMLIIPIVLFVAINLLFENILDRQWGVVIVSFFYSLLIFHKNNDESKV
ncbi:MAG: O-antigen ligase family protein [Flavobacteriales bacterium]|nr:O-antigen ligase family protein [Flavobacteriales bacterium]